MTDNIFPILPQFAPLAPELDKVDAWWFDLDGTLVDNEGLALDLIRDIISAAIIKVTHDEHPGITQCYRHLAGRKLDEIIQIAQDDTDIILDSQTINQIKEQIILAREHAHQNLTSADAPVVRHIAAFAQFLKDQGKPVCIVTASEPDRALHYVQASGLDSIFSGPTDSWLFASNLKDKGVAHHTAREALSRLHGFDIDPRRWVGFEDSPNAIPMAVKAGGIVIPHTLSTHISEPHIPARLSALRQAKMTALAQHDNYEWVHVSSSITKRITDIGDVHVIRKPSDFISVMMRTLKALPERGSIAQPQVLGSLTHKA